MVRSGYLGADRLFPPGLLLGRGERIGATGGGLGADREIAETLMHAERVK